MNWGEHRKVHYKFATGYTMPATMTKLGFIYLFGLIYARKQNIPGFLYFKNRYYNWIGAMKFLVPGYLVGAVFSSFTFGYPFLLEDYIRSKYRGQTASVYSEIPFPESRKHYRNKVPVRDPFVTYAFDYN